MRRMNQRASVAFATAIIFLAAALLGGCGGSNPLLADIEEMVAAAQRGTPPAAPTDLSAEANGPDSVVLAWTDVANEETYQLQRRVDGSADWTDAAPEIGADSTTYEDQGRSADIQYEYRIRAHNVAGNSGWSNTAVVTLVDPPTATISTPYNPTNAMPVPVTVKFSEDVTGFDETDVDVQNAEVSAGSFTQESAQEYGFDLVNPTSDPATIAVEIAADVATDAGGTGNVAASLEIEYDTNLLAAPMISGILAGEYNESQTFSVSGESGTTLQYSIDGGSSWAAYSIPVTVSTEGVYDITARQIDSDDRVSLAAPVVTVEIDLTPASAPTVTSDYSLWNSARPTWTWSSTDSDGSGTFRYRLNDPDLTVGAAITSQTSYTPPSDLSEGTHTLYVVERDDVGNWPEAGEYGSYSITVDTVPPGAPTVTGTCPTMDITPTWTWESGGGGNGSYRYRIDNADLSGEPFVATESFTAPSQSHGAHTLYVQERDDAGNTSPVGSYEISVNITPPSSGFSASGGVEDPYFEWDDVAGRSRFKIEISTDSSFGSIVATRYRTLPYVTIDATLNHDQTYYWRVRTSVYDSREEWGPPGATQEYHATYEIGETGPAGGLIAMVPFTKFGIYPDPPVYYGFYIEAVPHSTATGYPWGPEGTDIPGAWRSDLGTGDENTDDIIAAYGTNDGYAAQYCHNLSYGGYSDWVLPSHGDLRQVFENLHEQGFGNYAENWTWSSTEDSAILADFINFVNAADDPRRKTNNFYVIPVRYIPVE